MFRPLHWAIFRSLDIHGVPKVVIQYLTIYCIPTLGPPCIINETIQCESQNNVNHKIGYMYLKFNERWILLFI